MSDRIEQYGNRDNRHGQRQYDPCQDFYVRASIDCRGLLRLAGYGLLKEGAHNDDVPDGYGIRDNHDPKRIQHAEVLDQQIRWNESSAEKHREDQRRHDRISPDKILPGQRIGGKDGHREINERAKRRIYQRVGKAADDILVLKNFYVGIQVNAFGPQRSRPSEPPAGR